MSGRKDHRSWRRCHQLWSPATADAPSSHPAGPRPRRMGNLRLPLDFYLSWMSPESRHRAAKTGWNTAPPLLSLSRRGLQGPKTAGSGRRFRRSPPASQVGRQSELPDLRSSGVGTHEEAPTPAYGAWPQRRARSPLPRARLRGSLLTGQGPGGVPDPGPCVGPERLQHLGN